MLIVSNSAGTRLDPGEIQVRILAFVLEHAFHSISQAESVTHYLNVPVLRHKVFKPSYSCISSVRKYFSSLPQQIRDEELIVVGDRIFTDVVMANRMARKIPTPSATSQTTPPADAANRGQSEAVVTPTRNRAGPLSVWTSGVWEREAMAMRFLEKSFMQAIQRHVVKDNGVRILGEDVSRFIKPEPVQEPLPEFKRGLVSRLWGRIRR